MRAQSFICMHMYVSVYICVCMYLGICVCDLIMYFGGLELAVLKGGGKSLSDIETQYALLMEKKRITEGLKVSTSRNWKAGKEV